MERHRSNYAVYLGEGIWWQLGQRDYDSNRYSSLPMRYRRAAPSRGSGK